MELPITEEEIEFCECYYDPTALTECLMPLNENAPQTWGVDCECVSTRPYQFGMQNYSYLIAEDSELTAQEQMSKLKGSGDLYSIGSRNTGKSFYLKIDTLLEYIHGIKESCIASFDARHLKNVASPIALYIENHPFLQIFHLRDSRSKTVKRDPLNVITEHGAIIKGINEQVEGNEPGVQFHSLHYLSLKYEEASYMSEEGTKKRIDSGSSIGYVERLSGIPDLRIGSPLTQILTNPKNKRKIWRLPQYCVAENTKIFMANGSFKNIQDVKIGDEILTVTEHKPFKIIRAVIENKFYTGNKLTVNLESITNNIWVTPDHKFLCKINNFDKRWKNWEEYKNTYEVYSMSGGIFNIKDYYEGIFLGFLESEGSFKQNGLEKSIGQKVEKQALRFILDFLDIKYTSYQDKKDPSFEYFYLSVKNNKYINDLYIKLKTNRDCQLGCLVGFVLGDGSIYYNDKKKNKIRRELIIVQKNKIELLESILNKTNIRYSKYKHSGDGCFIYRINIVDLPIYAPFSIKGKKYCDIIQESSILPFKRTKLAEVERKTQPTWDLTTSAGTFIANGFVVHNCREDWCEATKESLAGKYGGESSNAYKLNVEAEILEGASGFWDMARLKSKALRQDRKIKYFEVSKENFADFENRIRIERLPGADQVYIASDIGLGHTPSEVIIIFRVGDIYKYTYQISLFKLIQKEQAQIFKWLYEKLGGAYIVHDATSDGGATIDELFSLGIPQEHLLKVKLNSNLEVDFQRDELGRILTNNNGEPLIKKINALDFAMQELENLIYSGNLEIAFDDKFLREFNAYFVKQTGLKKIYGSTSTDDLHQSFQVFAVARYFNENNPMENKKLQKRCYGVFK